MIKILIYPALLLISFEIFAQQLTKSSISNSGSYYYGSGISTDENQARQEALKEISDMIAVNVASRFELKSEEKDKVFKEQATSVINTYSMATLSNVESFRTVTPDGKIELFCYISKEDVKKLYDQRKDLVYKMYLSAGQSESEGNLAYALKNYYFGLVLLKSVPDEQIQVENTNLTIEIPKAINRVLHGINFKVVSDIMISEKEREIRFDARYMDKPVSLMHFRFWDGCQLSGSGQVRDGQAVISLYGSSLEFKELKCYPEYQYYNARKEYSALEDLWDLVIMPEFNNLILVNLAKQTDPVEVAGSNCSLAYHNSASCPVSEQIMKNTSVFFAVLNNGFEKEIEDVYGTDDFLAEKIRNYVTYNHPSVLQGKTEAAINETAHGYEVRKFMVTQRYPTLNKQATEYLVLDFSGEGTLVDFNLCITDELYEKFTEQAEWGHDWENRQEIIKFIEKYRTAYHTRDLNTINLMFAEEALILIGRKIVPRTNAAAEVGYKPLPGQPGFEQIKLTKEEYINRQKKIFDYQKDISIDFSTFGIVKKNNAPGIYGVEMRQNYSSTTYADEGYLFLLIDFNEKDPLIYIRAWQPNEWDTNALVNTSNFRIYK